jgi:peptidoglycan/LPS O-acetylase OafA/YrhL
VRVFPFLAIMLALGVTAFVMIDYSRRRPERLKYHIAVMAASHATLLVVSAWSCFQPDAPMWVAAVATVAAMGTVVAFLPLYLQRGDGTTITLLAEQLHRGFANEPADSTADGHQQDDDDEEHERR